MDPKNRQPADDPAITVLPTSSAPGPGSPLEQVLFEVRSSG